MNNLEMIGILNIGVSSMYIRTKDGVYEVESDYLNNKGVRVGYNVVGQEEVVLIENNNIIQSENIEELCDEFVCNGWLYLNEIVDNCLIEHSFDEEKTPIDNEMIKDGIYGAIWTKWGLKYVAKMNEKGDLELI